MTDLPLSEQYCAAYPSTQTISYTPSGSYLVPQSAGVSPTHVVTSSLSQASFSAVPGMQVEPSTIVTTVQSDQSTSGTVTAASSLASATVPFTTNISACVSNECVSTTAPSIYSLANRPSSITSTNAASAFPTSRPSGPPGGLVAGVAVGVVAACALLAAGLFATRRHWLTCCGRPHGREHRDLQMEKPSAEGSTPPGTGKTEDTPDLRGVETFHSPDHILRHAELDAVTGRVSAPPPVDTAAVHGLGIAGMSPRRYAPTNPDPEPATDEEHSPTDTASPTGLSEAPGDRLLPVSPAVSSLAPLPDTPNISNTPVGLSAVSPVTPSYRHSSTPYTPSAYQFEPPSSVPRTAAAKPPSLPQDYSSASLGSSANIYRGLSQHGGAPWAYLSPEEAVGGGWRNEEAPDGA